MPMGIKKSYNRNHSKYRLYIYIYIIHHIDHPPPLDLHKYVPGSPCKINVQSIFLSIPNN